MQIQYVICRKTSLDCKMCYSRWNSLVTMVTLATNIMKTMSKFALIKSVAIWVYEYDNQLVMDSVHLIEIFEHPAYGISTKILVCFALITRVGCWWLLLLMPDTGGD